jgi:hypothetical protein
MRVLEELGIDEPSAFARVREIEIIKIKNVGRKTLAELRELATAHGSAFDSPLYWGRISTRCDFPGCVRKLGHGDRHFGGRPLSDARE